MTNKEIKLELAKVALIKCNFTTRESLSESLKNLYEWIVEEPEVEEEPTEENSFDSVYIKDVLYLVRKNQHFSSGIATMLESVCNDNNINTVGDLIRIGRREFSSYRLVGKKSIGALDDALTELGIKSW